MPTVRFLPSERIREVPAGTLLIDAIRDAGLPIARACGDDLICGKCGVKILEGEVRSAKPVELRAKQRNRVPDELRLACVIRIHDDLDVTADYWGPGAP